MVAVRHSIDCARNLYVLRIISQIQFQKLNNRLFDIGPSSNNTPTWVLIVLEEEPANQIPNHFSVISVIKLMRHCIIIEELIVGSQTNNSIEALQFMESFEADLIFFYWVLSYPINSEQAMNLASPRRLFPPNSKSTFLHIFRMIII